MCICVYVSVCMYDCMRVSVYMHVYLYVCICVGAYLVEGECEGPRVLGDGKFALGVGNEAGEV